MYSYSSIYFVYIVTNSTRSTLYIGVTNNLISRVIEHWDCRNGTDTFAGKYKCHNLVYYESFDTPEKAIAREKQLKKWSRDKKDTLISSNNPEWKFLNKDIIGEWPPINFKRRF